MTNEYIVKKCYDNSVQLVLVTGAINRRITRTVDAATADAMVARGEANYAEAVAPCHANPRDWSREMNKDN